MSVLYKLALCQYYISWHCVSILWILFLVERFDRRTLLHHDQNSEFRRRWWWRRRVGWRFRCRKWCWQSCRENLAQCILDRYPLNRVVSSSLLEFFKHLFQVFKKVLKYFRDIFTVNNFFTENWQNCRATYSFKYDICRDFDICRDIDICRGFDICRDSAFLGIWLWLVAFYLMEVLNHLVTWTVNVSTAIQLFILLLVILKRLLYNYYL